MNVEKMERNLILANLKKINLLNENGTKVSYSVFKSFASIHKYGKQNRNQLKVVYVGIPRDTLFGFYVESNPDPLCMKQAYEWYTKLVSGKIDFDSEVDIHFGNMGIPITYGYVRYLE